MTILVTGASRGIGKAIAARFAQANYNVALNATGLNPALWATEQELAARDPHAQVAAFAGDMSDYDEASRVMREITARFGEPDVLINNAGIAATGLFADSTPADWQRLINTNINAMLNTSHMAAQFMARRHSGAIINISSIWGVAGASCEAVYSMTKGAVNAFTRALGKELGPCGVRVNAIACGLVDTAMNANLTAEDKAAFLEDVPLSRIGTPEEIAETAFFLASDAASYINAQIIIADGGLL